MRGLLRTCSVYRRWWRQRADKHQERTPLRSLQYQPLYTRAQTHTAVVVVSSSDMYTWCITKQLENVAFVMHCNLRLLDVRQSFCTLITNPIMHQYYSLSSSFNIIRQCTAKLMTLQPISPPVFCVGVRNCSPIFSEMRDRAIPNSGKTQANHRHSLF